MPSLPFETSAIVKRAESVSWTCLDGEAILLDLQSGSYYTLNEVGCAIWQHLDGVRTIQDVCQEICAIYDVEPHQAEHDILAVCGDLYQEQLVTLKSSV